MYLGQKHLIPLLRRQRLGWRGRGILKSQRPSVFTKQVTVEIAFENLYLGLEHVVLLRSRYEFCSLNGRETGERDVLICVLRRPGRCAAVGRPSATSQSLSSRRESLAQKPGGGVGATGGRGGVDAACPAATAALKLATPPLGEGGAAVGGSNPSNATSRASRHRHHSQQCDDLEHACRPIGDGR